MSASTAKDASMYYKNEGKVTSQRFKIKLLSARSELPELDYEFYW